MVFCSNAIFPASHDMKAPYQREDRWNSSTPSGRSCFWALVPAIVAIVLALITKETYSSLFIGILVGALLLTGFDPIGTVDAIISGSFIPEGGTEEDAMITGLVPSLADSAGIFIFLVILGIFVALINATGASAAFGKWAAKNVKSRIGAQLATFVLGVLIFVDDYFNCLTVGSVMRPVTDAQTVSRAKLSYLIDATAAPICMIAPLIFVDDYFNCLTVGSVMRPVTDAQTVSRAKLSYLIDATAAPICMIAPVSSWAAAVSGVAADLNVDGIQLFVSAIPFNFYSLLTLVFVIAIIVMGFDYGPMAKAELAALRDGELGSLGNDESTENVRAKLFDMIIPILVLIVFCIIGMLYVGGFWDPEAEGYMNVILAFGNTDAFTALPWGSLIALLFAFVYLILRRVISFKDAMKSIVPGFEAMVPAIIILTFALTLKSMTSALGAAEFVSGCMEGAAAGLYSMLPAIIFLVGGGLAFACTACCPPSSSSSAAAWPSRRVRAGGPSAFSSPSCCPSSPTSPNF